MQDSEPNTTDWVTPAPINNQWVDHDIIPIHPQHPIKEGIKNTVISCTYNFCIYQMETDCFCNQSSSPLYVLQTAVKLASAGVWSGQIPFLIGL